MDSTGTNNTGTNNAGTNNNGTGNHGRGNSVKYVQVDPEDYTWSVAAFEAIQNGTLTRRLHRGGGDLVASVAGLCPRCADQIDWSRTVAASAVVGVLRLEVICGCEQVHPGAPSGITGCGVGFHIDLQEGRDG
ncbi:MAG: hypothetical protein ACOYEV_04900 [Candidatus Nanopelagicales bacterium]